MPQIIYPIPRKLTIHFSYKRDRLYFIVLFALIGFLLSIMQVFGNSPDFSEYNDFFDLVRSEGLDTFLASRFEPGFSLLAFVLTMVYNSNILVYGWIVAITMLLKGWAISACTLRTQIFLVAAAFYLVRYFPLHELTQLRAACAIALIILGASFLWAGKSRRGLLICASAVLFQVSAVAIIPALFLPALKRWQVILFAAVAFLLTYIFTGLITEYLAQYIQILNSYRTHGFADVKPNPFAIQLLIDWGMIAISFIMWNKLTVLMKRIILLELIGMAIFYGGIEFGIVAHRLREFYSVFWVFFVANGLRMKTTKILCYSFVIVCIPFYSYVFFISGKFFH